MLKSWFVSHSVNKSGLPCLCSFALNECCYLLLMLNACFNLSVWIGLMCGQNLSFTPHYSSLSSCLFLDESKKIECLSTQRQRRILSPSLSVSFIISKHLYYSQYIQDWYSKIWTLCYHLQSFALWPATEKSLFVEMYPQVSLMKLYMNVNCCLPRLFCLN